MPPGSEQNPTPPCRLQVEAIEYYTKLEQRLKEGDPTVRCRTEFMSLGKLDLDPRPLVEGDKELIVEKLRKIMEA